MDNYVAVSDHMLNLPMSGPNPLDFEWLRDTQDAITSLMHQCDKGISGFSKRRFNGIELVCFAEKGREENNHWKICLTDEAVVPAIAWFHKVLGHPGMNCLLEAMHSYYHPNLQKLIYYFCCNTCQ